MLGSQSEALISTCLTLFHIHYWRQFFPRTSDHPYFTISSSGTDYQAYSTLQTVASPMIYHFGTIYILTEAVNWEPKQHYHH